MVYHYPGNVGLAHDQLHNVHHMHHMYTPVQDCYKMGLGMKIQDSMKMIDFLRPCIEAFTESWCIYDEKE